MSESYDPVIHAQQVIQRGTQLVKDLPANFARLLWRRVLLFQESGVSDPAVGVYLACAGAQISLYTTKAPVWDDQHEGLLYPALYNLLNEQDNLFELNTVQNLNVNNYHHTFRFTITEADFDTFIELAQTDIEPFDTILIEGISQLLKNPREAFAGLHDLCLLGGLIEIIPCPGEQCTETDITRVKQAAIESGFGIRHFSTSLLSKNAADLSNDLCFNLGLICLSSPLTDFPVIGRENTQIMAHCHARLDIACKLVPGKTVLDAGGAAGIGARRYLKAGALSVVSLDVNTEAIRIGRDLSGDLEPGCLIFKQWDLNKVPLPFADNSFDVVICLEVIEHIIRQKEVIQEYYRVLRPGGVLLASIPDNHFEMETSRINQHENPFHLHVPARDELSDMISDFEEIYWIRQQDVTASLVFEENYKGLWKGRFASLTDWDPHAGKTQVIAVVCIKPETDDNDAVNCNTTETEREKKRTKKKKKLRSKLLSSMHPWGDNTDTLLQLRRLYTEQEHRALSDRYDWWCKCNRLHAENELTQNLLTEMNTLVSEAEANELLARTALEKQSREFACRSDQLVNERDTLQDKLDKLNYEISEANNDYQQQREEWDRERSSLNDSIQLALKQLEESQNQIEESRSRLEESNNNLDEMSGRLKSAQQDQQQKEHLIEKMKNLETTISRERERFEKDRELWQDKSDKQQDIIRETLKQNDSQRSQTQLVQNKLDQAGIQLEKVRRESQRDIHELQSRISETTLLLNKYKSDAESSRLKWEQEKQQMIIERERLIQQLGEKMSVAVKHIERRCLDIESRVYDVEDELDQALSAAAVANSTSAVNNTNTANNNGDRT